MAAHLAGVVAGHTTLPVIGVPLSAGAANGVDALYATVQMPKGIPVATVAIDGAMSALLAVQILAVDDADLADELARHREEMAPKPRLIGRSRRAVPAAHARRFLRVNSSVLLDQVVPRSAEQAQEPAETADALRLVVLELDDGGCGPGRAGEAAPSTPLPRCRP